MISTPSIRDQVVLASNPAALRVPAFRVLDRMQDQKPGTQLLATAVALVAMAEAVELPMQDLMAIARRAMTDAEGPFTHHIQAIRDYALNELKRGGRR